MNLNLRFAFGIVALMGLSMTSCDTLDDPVIGVIAPCDASEAPAFEPLESDIQRILVEDFTAHQCGNCPPAAVKAAELLAEHPDHIVPLAIHAGELASTNVDYPIDWTCDEGDVFWEDLEFQLNPIGRVNRLSDETNILVVDQWDAAVDALLDASPAAGLQMAVDQNPSTGELAIHVHTTWFEAVEGPVRLGLLVAENHVVGPQLWYPTVDPPGPGLVEDYDHEHVLRGSVTGAKGLVVAENPEAGDAHQECYTYAWNDAWDVTQSDLIAVLTSDNGSVIQTLAIHITE